MRHLFTGSLFMGSLVLTVCCITASPARGQEGADPFDTRALDPRTHFWKFKPSFGVHYDSFGQRYELADEDTLDLIDEITARLVTALAYDGETKVELKNSFGLGQEATRNDFFLSIDRRWSKFRLHVRDDFRLKAYAPGTEFTFSSDYLVNTTRLAATWQITPAWKLRLDERFELTRVDERSRYNYNYHRNDVGPEIERSYALFSSWRLGYRFGHRTVPDSIVIDYQRHQVRSDWSHEFGRHHLSTSHFLERRRYADSNLRSHFVDYEGSLTFNLILRPQYRLRPYLRGNLVEYDTPDSIYSNSREWSLEVLLEKDFGERVSLGLGPRLTQRRTNDSFERPYDQWGAKGTLSYFAGTNFWVQFSNELGRRHHLAGDDFLYTDFYFNWSTLSLSWEVVPQAVLDLYFSMNPETHEDKANNTTTILVSTSLTYAIQ